MKNFNSRESKKGKGCTCTCQLDEERQPEKNQINSSIDLYNSVCFWNCQHMSIKTPLVTFWRVVTRAEFSDQWWHVVEI